MQSEELVELSISALENLKAVDIRVLDVRKLTDVTDYMIMASGRSNRQVRALAEEVALAAKRIGVPPMGTEGEKDGEWILVDLCDVVVHVMQPEIRDLYQLEKLWTEPEETQPEDQPEDQPGETQPGEAPIRTQISGTVAGS